MNFYSTSTIKAILKLQKLLYSPLNVTLSVKTHTSMYIEKKRNLKEITHATGKCLQGLMRPAISEGSFKSTKLYIILLAWLWRVQNFFFFVSVA